MGILRITLFGGVRLTHNDWLTEEKLRREIQGLLAFLLLYRHRTHPREILATVFWGERAQERARGSLSTALWRLKKILEPEGISPGTYLINAHSGEVGFNQESQYWLDLEIFEEEMNRVVIVPFQTVASIHVENLERTLELYKGDLLEGFYDDWALRERERMRVLYLKGLIYLMRYDRFHGLLEKGIAYGQQILDLAPLREEIHRELIRLYLESGQRARAAQQYEFCRMILAKELGILPMEETQALYVQNFPEAGDSRSTRASGKPIHFEQAIDQLRQASQAIDFAQEQIQQALMWITPITKDHDQTPKQ